MKQGMVEAPEVRTMPISPSRVNVYETGCVTLSFSSTSSVEKSVKPWGDFLRSELSMCCVHLLP